MNGNETGTEVRVMKVSWSGFMFFVWLAVIVVCWSGGKIDIDKAFVLADTLVCGGIWLIGLFTLP